MGEDSSTEQKTWQSTVLGKGLFLDYISLIISKNLDFQFVLFGSLRSLKINLKNEDYVIDCYPCCHHNRKVYKDPGQSGTLYAQNHVKILPGDVSVR